jgi:WD40 repeat protein
VLDATSGRQVLSLTPQVTFTGYGLGDTTLAKANVNNDGADVWSLASGRLLATLNNPDHHFEQGSAISADGKIVAVNSDGSHTHHIYVWNVTSQRLLVTLTIPTLDGEVDNPDELSSDGTTLAIGIGTTTRIYDVRQQRQIPQQHCFRVSWTGRICHRFQPKRKIRGSRLRQHHGRVELAQDVASALTADVAFAENVIHAG